MSIAPNSAVALCRIAPFFLVLAMLGGSASAGERTDLEKAVRIGMGKTMVVEFTDPDCPFCRKAASYFHDRRDVTLYVFLNPLALHPRAREKAQYILSASDRAKAYEEVMAGKFDGKPPTAITQAGIRLLDEHRTIARKEKVGSVPTFIISGRIVEGFDLRRIEELLPR